MRANKPGKIHFMSSSYSGGAVTAEAQRIAHSHAARTAHAKARHLSMMKYQAGKTRQTSEGSQKVVERGNEPRDSALLLLDAIKTEELVLPSPVSLLASDRRDPFNSFARSFEPIEHFLLDHCEHLHPFHCSLLLRSLSVFGVFSL
jgi:hypothetical protein